MSSKTDELGIEDARVAIASGEAEALDIRDEEQWSEGHVSGAIHLPKDRFDSELETLDSDSKLVVFADDDRTAAEAVETLRERGFEAVVAKGGMKAWDKKDFRTQPTADPDEDTELGGG